MKKFHENKCGKEPGALAVDAELEEGATIMRKRLKQASQVRPAGRCDLLLTRRCRRRDLLLLLVFVLMSCTSGAQIQAERAVLGGARIQSEQETGPPARPPRTVYVEDFVLDYQNVQADEGLRGRVGTLQRLPRLRPDADPAERARKLVDLLAQSLVTDLTEAGIPAQRLAPGAPLPADGWLLHGAFVEVDEGNRLRRAVIGFGSGGTQMEIMVAVDDLARTPIAPFIIFGTVTDPSKLPGAVVTLNPYMAAAKFVLEKNATDKDVKHTSKEIVNELLKYKQKFEEQARSTKPAP